MHRPFPTRKTLGTRYNLRPATAPVEAQRLQPGDVIVVEAEHPVVVLKMKREHGTVRIWAQVHLAERARTVVDARHLRLQQSASPVPYPASTAHPPAPSTDFAPSPRSTT